MSRRQKSVDELLLEIAQEHGAAPTLTMTIAGKWCCAVGVKFTAVTDGVFFTESMYLEEMICDTPAEAVALWQEHAHGGEFRRLRAEQVIVDMENDPDDGRTN